VRHARLAAALLALALAGCGGPLVLQFRGGEKLNLNAKEPPESIPVVVRVFLLKDKATFQTTAIEQLWTKEKYKAALGSDLVGEPREITIFASKPDKLDLGKIEADVRFVGIMAMYQKKTDPPSVRHVAVPKEEAAAKIFELVDYRIEVK
jgi:type VI secretion system VasD/TssJ family lipoprotein